MKPSDVRVSLTGCDFGRYGSYILAAVTGLGLGGHISHFYIVWDLQVVWRSMAALIE